MPLFLACWQKKKWKSKQKKWRFHAWAGLFYHCQPLQREVQRMWAVMESKANVSGAVHSPVTQILQMRNVKKMQKKKIKVSVHTRSAGWWVNFAEGKISHLYDLSQLRWMKWWGSFSNSEICDEITWSLGWLWSIMLSLRVTLVTCVQCASPARFNLCQQRTPCTRCRFCILNLQFFAAVQCSFSNPIFGFLLWGICSWLYGITPEE